MNEKNKEIIKKRKADVKKELKRFHRDTDGEPISYAQEENAHIDIKNILDKLTNAQKDQAKELIRNKKAKFSYIEYLKYVFPNYIWTPFHIFLANVCETVVHRVEKGEKVRIVLSIPPRHGKTETITNTLPSWFVGRNPDKNAILTAYNADLAEKFEDANRQKTRLYGKDIFGIEISDSQDNKTLYQIKNHKGGVMGVGIQGGITGNGGELIIIDDPYKNSQEANSPATRKMIEQIYRDSIYTRTQGKGNAIILVQTRWHEEDLAGVLSKEDDWIVINIPCVCDNPLSDALKRKDGQTLCPELGFDAEWAIQTQKSVGLKVWNALYQGKPSIDGGSIFLRDKIKFYNSATLPPFFDEEVMSCDLSFGGIKQSNDPCAIQIWGRVGANHYLLKRIKKRMNFNEMCNMIKLLSEGHPFARKKIVEKKANGQAVIDSLNSVIGGFEEFDPKMIDKVGRANAITPYFESGNVYLPDKSIDNTIDEMVEEMMKFPNSQHDDEVDAMTQYLNSWQYRSSGKISTDKAVMRIADAWRNYRA